MSDDAELKQNRNSSERPAISQVLSGHLTAKEVLKKVFNCARSLTDAEILQRVREALASDSGTHFGSFFVNSVLRSSTVGQFLQLFWSNFNSLDETNKGEVAVVLLSRLKEYAKSRRGGRPKGTKAPDTEQHILRIAALQFFSASRTAAMSFIYGTEPDKWTRRQAFSKFLQRHAMAIDQQSQRMTEIQAREIVRSKITIALATQILKSGR